MGLDPTRTIAELKELRELTSDENGAQRVAWTECWQSARDWFQTKLIGLPVEHHLDPAGNSWVTLPGESERVLILGSHLDSVPNGGWLDGALGVLTGLEILRRFNEEFEGKPPLTIRLVDWADEEGARFGRSLLGSSAFAGNHTIAADRGKLDRDGIRLEAALREYGVEIHQFPEAEIEQRHAEAYLELHIEQGPILERHGLPLAVVTGTKGVERHKITFFGQEAHSGATPMTERKDALVPLSKLALEIYNIAGKHPDAVSTIGSVKTFPGIVTAVVGRCEATLDQRDLSPAVLAQMLSDAENASQQFAEEAHCLVAWEKILNIAPIAFDRQLMHLCGQAISEMGCDVVHLPSGPLHDAAEVSRAGIPSVMMFVQSLRGISHNKIEDTNEDHLELAVRAMDRLASKAAAWILAQRPG